MLATTESLIKSADKMLSNMMGNDALSDSGAAARDKLESLIEDVRDSRRPLERCMRTKKTLAGEALTTEAFV